MSEDKMDIEKFIKELPNRISWINDVDIDKIISLIDDKDYYVYFNEWKDLNYDGGSLAKKAETSVFNTLVDGDIHKHYENPLSYELSDNAKKIRPIANNIYSYVIYLQLKDRFSDKAKLYCKQMEKYFKVVVKGGKR